VCKICQRLTPSPCFSIFMFTFKGSYFHHCFLLLPLFNPFARCIKFHTQPNASSKLCLMPHKLMLWHCILTLLQVPPSPIDASTNLDIAIAYCNLLTLLQVSTLPSFVKHCEELVPNIWVQTRYNGPMTLF